MSGFFRKSNQSYYWRLRVLVFACSAYSRCGSWTFTWTFLAVTRCSVSGITIETIQTDLAVKASSVVSTILSTNKSGRCSVKQCFSFQPVLSFFNRLWMVSLCSKLRGEESREECNTSVRVWHTKPRAAISISDGDESRSQSRSLVLHSSPWISELKRYCSQSSSSISFTCTVRYKG